jgi:hypothetical protein
MSLSDTPQYTGIPYLIDSDVQNTLDLQVAVTNFTNLVEVYGNEIVLSYIWNYTKAKNDPILSQANFFSRLNQDSLQLIDNPEGSKNPHIKNYFKAANNIQLNDNEIWLTGADGSLLSRIDPQTGNLQYIAKINTPNGSTRFVDVLENVNETVNTFLSKLENNYGEANLPTEVALFWIDRFEKSVVQVQEEYKKLDPTFETGIFQPLGDSIGIITRYDENYQTVNIPLLNGNIGSPDPNSNMFPPIVGDKLDIEQKRMILEFNQKASFVHRTNLQYIRKNRATNFLCNYPHGENLVTDDNYTLIIGQLKNDLVGKIAVFLDKGNKIFAYKQFVGKEHNNQVLTKVLYSLIVETNIQTIDNLKKKFEVLTKEALTATTLGVTR